MDERLVILHDCILIRCFSAAWVPIIYLYFPETKGLELEQVDRLFVKNVDEFDRSMSLKDSSSNGEVDTYEAKPKDVTV